MRRFRFPIAVAATSLALVAAIAMVGAMTVPIAGLTVRSALANGPWAGGPFGHPGFSGPNFRLPAELQGIRDLPPEEAFTHFAGVQVNLKDKDNRPLAVKVTPGKVTAAGEKSLTIAANDGTERTFTLNDDTMVGGKQSQEDTQSAVAGLSKDDLVVVVTLDDVSTAVAVVECGGSGFGGFGGPPWAWGR